MKPLTFGSLFAGIGGFDLGFERAGMECKWQVEIDEYAYSVLQKHWPLVPKWHDVRTFPPALDEFSHKQAAVDVICGGFPCQDISDAGKRVGIDGERSGLWKEFARIVRVLRPRFVVVENVPALLRRGMGRVCGDLAASGYDCQWDCIPAGSIGAHFVGDRLFIVAENTKASGLRRQGCWAFRRKPAAASAWGSDEFKRLVRKESQHGVPAGSLGRISDGIPKRVDRLRGLGNAVVPQVAEFIGRMIVEHASKQIAPPAPKS